MAHEPWLRREPTADASRIDALVQSPARLAAVERTQLLDSETEEAFDGLVRLAARLIGAPAAFVSVIGGDRDFYKSQLGFSPPLSVEREVSGRTFCHYALLGDQTLVIDDTHAHPVWRAVPTVDSLRVRAYVGVPLKLDEQTIGSFCVVDVKPRTWTAEELETLQLLGVSAAREIKLRSALNVAHVEAARSIELARAREEVVAVVAHDLRTPLQVLALGTHVLQKSLAGEQEVRTTARMLKAIDAMTAMTDSLLSSAALMAPSAAGKRAFDGAQLARDAVGMMSPIAERAGIALALGQLPAATVQIDYAQLLRVLGNLVGNAIKYSPEGSTVTVSADFTDGELGIEVRDNGKGMTAEEQRRAFERGWQGGDGMVRGDGAGLGLAIARTLVEQHGGRIAIGGAPGQGTTVTVTLPAAAPPAH